MIALGSGVLQKAGGTFTLTAEVDFGASFGLKSAYFKSRGTNPAAAGVIRLANAESISWRNAANGADLAFKANASNRLEFNGTELVTASSTETFTNKSLSDSTTAIVDVSDATKKIKFDAAGTTGTSTTIAGSQTADRTLTLPDATDTLVGRATTDTLTNKTLTTPVINEINTSTDTNLNLNPNGTGKVVTDNLALSGNTIESTNTNGDLNATANGTGKFKVESGAGKGVDVQSAGHMPIGASVGANDITLGGGTSTVKVPGALQVTGTITGNVTGNLTGNASGTAANVTGTVAIANGGTGQTSKTAAFDALSPTTTSGDMIYHSGSANVRLPIGSSGQVLKQVGGVPTWATFSGGINYLSSNPDAEADTTGWDTYDDAASAPVDGTGGTVTTTWTRTTSSPLRGTASFLLTKDAANRQGEGARFDFTIDSADLAKVLQIEFDYTIASGTYADGDLTAYLIADPSGTPVVIQPAGYSIQNVSTGVPNRHIATFQTQASGTSYRLCIHVASTSASAYTVKFDNFRVGPQTVTYGAPVTDWTSYTPTLSWVTGISSNVARYRRIGDSIEIEGKISTSGAVTSAALTVSLPSGLSVDTSKFSGGAAENGTLGLWSGIDAGMNVYEGRVAYQSTTTVGFAAHNTSGTYATPTGVTQAAPFTWGATDELFYKFSVPISGWSSTVQMSNDTDTRVVAASMYRSSAFTTGTGGWQDIVLNASSFDTHGAYNTSTGIYTVAVPGKYRVSFVLRDETTAAQAAGCSILVNGSPKANSTGVTNATAGPSVTATKVVDLVAGDLIKFQVYATTARAITVGEAETYASIERLSGPSQIAASEKIRARYYRSSGQSLVAGNQIIDYSTKSYDSHGSVTTGASWKFTAPRSDYYRVSGGWGAASGGGSTYEANLHKNGTRVSYSPVGTFASGAAKVHITDTIYLLAGEYIDLRADYGGVAPSGSVTSGSLTDYITIESV